MRLLITPLNKLLYDTIQYFLSFNTSFYRTVSFRLSRDSVACKFCYTCTVKHLQTESFNNRFLVLSVSFMFCCFWCLYKMFLVFQKQSVRWEINIVRQERNINLKYKVCRNEWPQKKTFCQQVRHLEILYNQLFLMQKWLKH